MPNHAKNKVITYYPTLLSIVKKKNEKNMRATITIQGIVQGVGFRPFIHKLASDNNLTGYVRNQGDSTVLIVVQGKRVKIEQFLSNLKYSKPPLASYFDVIVEYSDSHIELEDFKILESLEDRNNLGSTIPPDVAVCEQCIDELFDASNRRFKYYLISCNDCGPRFSIVTDVPYDRMRTSMNRFAMCTECESEYTTCTNRRFHNQAISCKNCGPRMFLTSKDGKPIDIDKDPISYAGKLIEEGKIIVIKGVGGFHIATSSVNSEPISRLRIAKDRKNKPFAVMAKNIDYVRSFATLTEQQAQILSSYQRPIVLLRKKEGYFLSSLVAPGLESVGVMLPYTAVHHLLFSSLKREGALVMTSANVSGTPIIHHNIDALRNLSDVADYFLMHDRDIINRCDDSVVQANNNLNNQINFIRRSRGYVPVPISLNRKSELCVLGLGAELNVTACVVLNNRAFLSQHIGDVDNLDTYLFLKESIHHLIKITNSKPQLIVSDLHPSLNTTRLASIMAKEMDCKIVQVQHHHAHVASLMAEHNIEEIIGIACDGVGYGLDGKIWGGEVILADSKGFRRLGSLVNQPMVGGDLATSYPLIMAGGILAKILGNQELEDFLRERTDYLPKGEKSISIIIHSQLEKRKYHETSSTGRILDATAAILGICYERTYEGEPAIRLAANASTGQDVLCLEPQIVDSQLDTTYLIQQIYENRGKFKAADLACSAESYLARGLVTIAIQRAKEHGIRVIGFSGGVAYNDHIASVIKNEVEQNNLRFVMNNKVPAGDGGISLGQTYVAISQY